MCVPILCPPEGRKILSLWQVGFMFPHLSIGLLSNVHFFTALNVGLPIVVMQQMDPAPTTGSRENDLARCLVFRPFSPQNAGNIVRQSLHSVTKQLVYQKRLILQYKELERTLLGQYELLHTL